MNEPGPDLPRVNETPTVATMLRDHSGRLNLPRLAGLVMAGAGLLLLALVTLPYYSATRATTWPWWTASRLLLALPLLWMIGRAITYRPASLVARDGGMATLWRALWGGFAGMHLISAMMSAHVRESAGAALGLVSFAVLSVVLAHWLSGGTQNANRLGWTAATAGMVIALTSLGLWSYYGVFPEIRRIMHLNAELGFPAFSLHPHGFRNDQPLGHSSYTAGIAVLSLPWVVWAAVVTRRRWTRLAWAAGALAVFATLLTSGSRGGLLGLAGAAGWGVILAARAARWSRRTYAFALGGACVLLAGLVLAVPRVRNSVEGLLQGQGADAGDRQRIAMLEVGMAMGLNRWWVGHGPGLTTRLYPEYRHQVEGGTPTILQLHSTPLQLWADVGLPGLLFGAGLVAAGLYAAVRRMRSPAEEGRPNSMMVGAAGVSLVGYAMFALTDYQLDLPVTLGFLAVNFAVLAATPDGVRLPDPGKPASRRGRVFAAWGGVAVLLLGVVVTVPEWQARGLFAGAVHALERDGDVEQFSARIRRASYLLPDSPHLAAGGAVALLHPGLSSSDAAAQRERVAHARTFLQAALRIDPNLEYAHFNLGWLLLAREPAAAAAHFRRWIWLMPDRAGGYYGLGLALLEMGDVERGRDAVALEIVNDPAFLTSPVWDVPDLVPHREAVGRRALSFLTAFLADGTPPEAAMLGYVQGLLRWWLGEAPDFETASIHAAESAVEHFARSSGKAIATTTDPMTPDTPGWRVLAAAAAQPGQRRALLAQYLFVRRAARPTDGEVAILEQMVLRLGTDWRAWLQAPEGRDAPFMRSYRTKRPAYAVIARNLDIPVPWDVHVVQENELATIFFDQVFPERGWVSDARLLREVKRIAP